jgi:hypothetical protein
MAAQNIDVRSQGAGVNLRSWHGAQTNRQTVNRATGAAAVVVDNPAPQRVVPLEGPIAVLDQRVCANAIPTRGRQDVQRGQRAGRRDFEDRPARCPVEVADDSSELRPIP